MRQADILHLREIHVGSGLVACPEHVVILSQTCDLVLADRPNITVAQAVRLNANTAAEVLRGKRPRWVPVTGDVGGLFADLEVISSIPKTEALDLTVERSIPDERWAEQRKFAHRVGRRFSRLALPDEVVPWLKNLSDLVISKAGKATSPLGRAIEAISEIRVAADDWSRTGASMELFLILEAGELPIAPDDHDDWSLALPEEKPLRTIPGVSDRLFPVDKARPAEEERNALWWRFAELVQDIITPAGPMAGTAGVKGALASVVVSIADETEFTMAQYRRSDELDLSHLSSPLPLSN
ncbi:hypothetical protein KXS11_11590 [Plantibacter flavus]|uniref:hypothetical protein n=1 Tax=Plantibacter flavus TaxID=150123 RepID=UPI003F156565